MRRRLLLLALGLLAVCPAAADWTAAADEVVPLEAVGGGWLLRVTIDSRVRATFLLDTGATLCVVSPDVARKLGLHPTGEVVLHTANGDVRAPTVRLRSLEAGDTRARDVDAVVHDAAGGPVEGVLGLNFLNRFQYAIDPKHHALRLR